MRERFSGSVLAVIAASGAVISGPIDPTAAQAPAPPITASAPALTTPWGGPDLQGIWTDETDTSLQRSPKYASQEFFSEEQRAELAARHALPAISQYHEFVLAGGLISYGVRYNVRPPDLIDFVMTPNRRLSAVRCQETEFRWC